MDENKNNSDGDLLHRKTPLMKRILLFLLYGSIFHPSFSEKNPDDFGYLSIASAHFTGFGYFCLAVYLLFSFINVMSSTGDQSMPHWPITGMIILYMLAIIFGVTGLFRNLTKRSKKMASSGILLSAIPLIILGIVYIVR